MAIYRQQGKHFAIIATLWGMASVCISSPNAYHSNLLLEMATAGRLVEQTDTLHDGFHYRNASYKNTPLTVIVANNEVTHIGYAIFTPSQRAAMSNNCVADFIERYWLSLSLPLKRDKDVVTQMREDRFFIEAGTSDSYSDLVADTTLSITCSMNMERTYTVEWTKEGQAVCRLSFPVNHELLLGRNMIENDLRFASEVKCAKVPTGSIASIPEQHLIAIEGEPYRLAKGDSYIVDDLSASRYYMHDGGRWQPLYSAKYPAQSVANMLTGTDMPQSANFSLTLCQQAYNYRKDTIETTLQQFVCYCLGQGCHPFVGIIGNDGTEMQVELIMRNAPAGYNHVATLKINTDEISKGRGCITARVNTFVPTSNILNLFNDQQRE